MAKIAYVGSFKNLWDEEGNALAFEALGHKVLRLEESTFIFEKDLIAIEKFKPDIVIYAKLKLPLKDLFMRKMKKYIRICWTFDLYFGLRREATLRTDPAYRAEFVFSPDGGNQAKFDEIGIKHHLLRQGIYDGYCHIGNYDTALDTDVAFVGSENYQWPSRSELCAFLENTYGHRFRWYGRFNTKEIRGHKLNDLYASAKVIVGDSVSSPFYWSNRIYETLGRGGFLIHPQIEGLDKEYTPFKHYIPFKFDDYKGLKEKIDYFLRKPNERRQIANSAFKHTLENHTLIHRVKQLMEIYDRSH